MFGITRINCVSVYNQVIELCFRNLTEKFDRAVDEIKKKRTEIQTSEWKTIDAHIDSHFDG